MDPGSRRGVLCALRVKAVGPSRRTVYGATNVNSIRSLPWIVIATTIAATLGPVRAEQGPASCKVTGRVTSGTTPLPGVSIVALRDTAVGAATSTETDGSYQFALAPGSYRL